MCGEASRAASERRKRSSAGSVTGRADRSLVRPAPGSRVRGRLGRGRSPLPGPPAAACSAASPTAGARTAAGRAAAPRARAGRASASGFAGPPAIADAGHDVRPGPLRWSSRTSGRSPPRPSGRAGRRRRRGARRVARSSWCSRSAGSWSSPRTRCRSGGPAAGQLAVAGSWGRSPRTGADRAAAGRPS